MSIDTLSRRTFLQVGGATVALGVGLAVAPGLADGAPETTITYALDPVGGGAACEKAGRGGCAACGACRSHAANKLFRTKEAADGTRAHKGCRCVVVEGQTVEAAVAEQLFAKSDAVDRRDPEVAKLLGSDNVPVPIIAGAAPVVLLAGGAAGIWWMRRRNRQAAPPDTAA